MDWDMAQEEGAQRGMGPLRLLLEEQALLAVSLSTTPSSGNLSLYGINSTSAQAYVGQFYIMNSAGWLNGTINANAFQILCSTGTISGTFQVYGLA